ncbi:MAG: hypothetical protein ACOCP8_08840, partial [archaeon]
MPHDIMKYNTTIKHSTHFLNPMMIIKKWMYYYDLGSEKCPIPTGHKIGHVDDIYYGEIWEDGDWQKTFWIIELVKNSAPVAIPIMKFYQNKSYETFNNDDFNVLLQSLLISQKQIQTKVFYPTFFGYKNIQKLKKIENTKNKCNMDLFNYFHLAQPKVELYILTKLIN